MHSGNTVVVGDAANLLIWCMMVFEVLQWLLFLSAVLLFSYRRVVRNGKSTAGHQRYLCSLP